MENAMEQITQNIFQTIILLIICYAVAISTAFGLSKASIISKPNVKLVSALLFLVFASITLGLFLPAM